MAFVDVTDLAGYLGRDVSDLGWLGEFSVRAAEEAVKGVIDQDVILVTDDEVRMDGTGTSALLLDQLPVVDITSITENDVELTEDTDFYLAAAGIVRRTWPTFWRVGLGNIVVTYSHGWSQIGDPDGNQVPLDIREAALDYAKGVFEAGASPPPGLTGETLPTGYAYTQSSDAAASAAQARLPGLRERLSRYRMPRVA